MSIAAVAHDNRGDLMDDAERRADFTAYVSARQAPLARLAYLLTGHG